MNLLEYKTEIDRRLKSYLDLEIDRSPPTEAVDLLKRLKTVVKNGKRFRPSLFFITYKTYGGNGDVVDIGVAIELLHQALLIHDDLIDGDSVRHGKPNITGLYETQYKDTDIANSMALLAGDLMLTLVVTPVLSSQSLSPEQKVNAVYILSEMLKTCIYGQQLDSLNINAKKNLNLPELLTIYSLKTSSYSCLLPTRLAASLLELSKKEKRRLDKFANNLGIYMQLINDHVDYQEELKDFSLGKVTPVYLLSKKLTSASDYKVLEKHFGKTLAPKDKQKVKGILTSSGVIKASQDLITKARKDCVYDLNKLDINAKSKEDLLALIDSIKV